MACICIETGYIIKMSLTNWPNMQGKDETETTRMTSSTITSNFTLESHEVYEEEFTLMTKPPSHHNKRLESCLAWKIAEKYPVGIKEETLKMIEYYETSLHSQIRDYHKLVEENARVKKQNQMLTSMNLEYEMKRSAR